MLTEEKETELVTNGKFNCSKYTAIAVIIKAATIIGCNLAAQNRLQSNSVNNLNEIVLKSVQQCCDRVESPKVGVRCGCDVQDALEKGSEAVEWTLKQILITCEDVFKTHMCAWRGEVTYSCCIESFLNCCIAGNLDYSENINAQYNTLSLYNSIQIAIQGFIDKFITVSVIALRDA